MPESPESLKAPRAVSVEDVMAPSRRPFELDDRLQAKVASLGLAETVRSLQEDGYGYVHDLADPDFNGRLRDTLLRLCRESVHDEGVGTLLDKDPIVAEAVLNPKLLAVAEVMCGKGALLSQVIGSVKPQGGPPLPLHVDQGWMPAPFPVHNQLVTFCWATDEFTRENGSTKVVPGSHRKGRHPTMEETVQERGAIAHGLPGRFGGGLERVGVARRLSAHGARRACRAARDVRPACPATHRELRPPWRRLAVRQALRNAGSAGARGLPPHPRGAHRQRTRAAAADRDVGEELTRDAPPTWSPATPLGGPANPCSQGRHPARPIGLGPFGARASDPAEPRQPNPPDVSAVPNRTPVRTKAAIPPANPRDALYGGFQPPRDCSPERN